LQEGGQSEENIMATKVDIWMPLYIADYLSATSRLTTEQHGAYLLLIMDYWKNGAPPDNDQVLAQITKLSPDAWSNARSMLKVFFQVQDGLWIQNRIELEMVKAQHNKQVNVKRGKAGAEARWNKNAPSIDEASSEVCSADSTSPSPSPSPTSKPSPIKIHTPEGVSDSVWQEFKSLRKAKKAPITQRAIDKISEEANLAGWTLEKALEECIVRGWQAFKAEWVAKKGNPADNIRLTVPASNEPDPALLKIAEDAKKAAPIPFEVLARMAQIRGRA
jgi:uncharacterized protein YdaU (DUF1376 family)